MHCAIGLLFRHRKGRQFSGLAHSGDEDEVPVMIEVARWFVVIWRFPLAKDLTGAHVWFDFKKNKN